VTLKTGLGFHSPIDRTYVTFY